MNRDQSVRRTGSRPCVFAIGTTKIAALRLELCDVRANASVIPSGETLGNASTKPGGGDVNWRRSPDSRTYSKIAGCPAAVRSPTIRARLSGVQEGLPPVSRTFR